MKKILKFLDIYGEEVRLFINESTRYKTLSGGILSLMVIIFCSFIFIYNLILFFTNRNLNVLLQTQFSKQFRPINLTNDNFYTAFHFTQNNGTLKGVKNYSLTLNKDFNLQADPYNRSQINSAIINCSNTNVIQSMLELIDPNNKTLYNNIIGDSSYCRFLFNNSTYFIGGDTIYSGINSFIITNFSVSFCNHNCTKEDLTFFTNNNYFYNMLFIDSYPNMTSPQGFSKFLNSYGFSADFTKDYLITINYQNNRITTDEGYFYPTNKNNTPFFNLKSISHSTTNRAQVNGDINFYILTTMDRNENIYTRTYQKLDSLFANTRALTTIIYQIFYFLNTIINYKKFDLKLINLFFHANDNEEKESINEGNSIKLNLVNEEVVAYHLKGKKLEGLQSILKRKFESKIIAREKNMINSSFKSLFCENKKKFDIGQELLKFHLDIRIVLKQLFDLEEMKSLLYENDELKVLKLINNCNPTFKENFFRDNFLSKNKNEKLDKIVESFAKFILHGNNKKLEKKLLRNLKMKFI